MLLFLKVFFTEFIAEMGDKTQLMLIALTSKYKLKDIICAFTSKEVKNEFKNVIFYENKNMTIDEALEYFYKANDIQRRKKENELRSFARYQVFVTEEEKRLRNEFSCMDYLDDDDIGGS